MKYLLLISLFLTGCATTQPPFVEVPKVQPSIEIMEACEEFVFPVDGSINGLGNALKLNKKVYEQCNKQNNSKKEFILNITR